MNNNTITTPPGGVEELIGDYKWPAFYFFYSGTSIQKTPSGPTQVFPE